MINACKSEPLKKFLPHQLKIHSPATTTYFRNSLKFIHSNQKYGKCDLPSI